MSNRRGGGKEVSRAGLAEFFGVAVNTVDHWVRTGVPVVTRGGPGIPWVFNTAAVARWREQRIRDEANGAEAASEAELRRRHLRAKTMLAELELAEARADLAPVDQMRKALQAAFAQVKANMRNVPARAVRMLIGESDEIRFKRVLLEEIDLALAKLSEDELVSVEQIEEFEPDEHEDDEDEAGA